MYSIYHIIPYPIFPIFPKANQKLRCPKRAVILSIWPQTWSIDSSPLEPQIPMSTARFWAVPDRFWSDSPEKLSDSSEQLPESSEKLIENLEKSLKIASNIISKSIWNVLKFGSGHGKLGFKWGAIDWPSLGSYGQNYGPFRASQFLIVPCCGIEHAVE